MSEPKQTTVNPFINADIENANDGYGTCDPGCACERWRTVPRQDEMVPDEMTPAEKARFDKAKSSGCRADK